MASADHEISGSPSDYYERVNRESSISYPDADTTNRGVGGPIFRETPMGGGTPAMRGVPVDYPNSNNRGIRDSINDGEEMAEGKSGSKVNPAGPYRHPVAAQAPIQRKPTR